MLLLVVLLSLETLVLFLRFLYSCFLIVLLILILTLVLQRLLTCLLRLLPVLLTLLLHYPFIFSPYTGRLPCFFAGLFSLFVSSISNALINLGLVCLGTNTSSTNPLCAAIYGFATVSLYSAILLFLVSTGSSESFISFLNIIFAAPSGPITAISA